MSTHIPHVPPHAAASTGAAGDPSGSAPASSQQDSSRGAARASPSRGTTAPTGGQARTVVDLFEASAARAPGKAILRTKSGGAWRTTTLALWRAESGALARGLLALGHQPGDRINLVSNTCREWLVADLAILFAAGVTVPIYQSAVADEAGYICQDSGARFAFVEDPIQLEKLLLQRDQLPALEKIIWFKDVAHLDRPDAQGRTTVRLADVVGDASGMVLGLAQLAELARSIPETALDERRAGIDPLQPCTIVYTSGTTGRPKGVVLTHDAFVFEVFAATKALDVRPDDSLLLFLPLAHIFAKIVYCICMALQTEMIIPQSMATLLADMAESRPTVLPSVPRVFEKVHARILGGVEEAGGLKKRVFELAMATGREVSRMRQRGREPTGALAIKNQLAHKLVFFKIHALFGGRIRAFISGGAPLSKELAEFFHAMGLLILEGYGLTENCAAATINRPDRFKFGTVGVPIEGVGIRIAPDGEILIQGRNLMTGYYNNPAATAEAIVDGWFHSGDIGEMDADGFLRITDRKKDIIVTAGGKNVAPQNLESHVKSSPFLSQVMVYGDRRKFLSALVTLDDEAIRNWAADRGIGYTSAEELTQNAEVYKLVEGIIAEKNRTLASYETIKKFAILERDLTVESGDLTPSLKMRRKEVTRKYQDLLDSFYSEHY